MPTPPHAQFLPLESRAPDIEDIINEVAGKLEESRNFGTYVFAWVGQAKPPDPLRLAPMVLFRHALEQLDAICILVRNHAPDAAMVNLRALMETWMYIWYMMEADTEGDRPKSWYQLAGGPNNIRGLAKDLHAISTYVGFYKKLSGMVHGGDIMEGRISASSRKGMGAFKQLHLLSNLQFVARTSILWSNSICQHLAGRYVPSKRSELRRWYLVEMQEFVMKKLPTLSIKHT